MKTTRVGDVARETHLVRDDDHGHALSCKLPHYLENLADQLGVEGRGDLVEKHNARAHGERARDRDAPPLAA